jgi:hypothetical protein
VGSLPHADRIDLAEREPDVVEPLEQALPAERIDRERSAEPGIVGHGACAEIDVQPVLAAGGGRRGGPPFWKQLLKKMSANVGAITARKP